MHRAARRAVPALLLLSVMAATAAVLEVGPEGAWGEAVASAAPGSTVVFAPGRYTNCSAGGVELVGDIALVSSAGAAATIIDCRSSTRHFYSNKNANVSISGLTMEGGVASGGHNSDGGCVLVEGMAAVLTVTDSVLSNCSAAGSGGAIAFRGRSLTLSRCSLAGNVAVEGGAIYATASSVEVHAVSSAENHASSGGGFMYLSGGNASIFSSTFLRNTAGIRGGAIVVSGHRSPYPRLSCLLSTIALAPLSAGSPSLVPRTATVILSPLPIPSGCFLRKDGAGWQAGRSPCGTPPSPPTPFPQRAAHRRAWG